MACSLSSPGHASFQEPIIAKVLRGNSFSEESSVGLSGMIQVLFGVEPQNVDQSELQFSEAEISSDRKILLVLPGARTLKDWSFSVATQHKIKSLFEEGRLKLLCVGAGAYYVSQKVFYNKEEKTHKHELHIFRGTCTGPAFEGDFSLTEIVVAGKVMNLVMNGGGYFTPFEEDEDCKVLATYPSLEGKAAVIAYKRDEKSGVFNSVLLGPHFEYDLNHKTISGLKLIHPGRSKEFDSMDEVLKENRLLRLDAMRSFLLEMGFK